MLIRVMLCFLGKVEGVSWGIAVMKKDLATLILEIVLVRKAGVVFLTAHFVSLELMFHSLFFSCTILWTAKGNLNLINYFIQIT